MAKIVKWFKSKILKVLNMFGLMVVNDAGKEIITDEVTGVMGQENSYSIPAKGKISVNNISATGVSRVLLSSMVGFYIPRKGRGGVVCNHVPSTNTLNIYNSGNDRYNLTSINTTKIGNYGEYGIDFGNGYGAISEGYKSLRLLYSGKGTVESENVGGTHKMVRVSVTSNSPPVVFCKVKEESGNFNKYVCVPFGTKTVGNKYDFYFLVSVRGSVNVTPYNENVSSHHFYVFTGDSKTSSSPYGAEIYDTSGGLVYSGEYITANVLSKAVIPFIRTNKFAPYNGNFPTIGTSSANKAVAINVTGANAIGIAELPNFGRVLYPKYSMSSDNNINCEFYTYSTAGQPGTQGSIGYQLEAQLLKQYTDSGYPSMDIHVTCIDVTGIPDVFGSNPAKLNGAFL